MVWGGRGARWDDRAVTEPTELPAAAAARFLTLDGVAAELNISRSQAYALVRGLHVRALKVGGRGQWRVERVDLESYITTTKAETGDWIATHPYTGTDLDADPDIDVDEQE